MIIDDFDIWRIAIGGSLSHCKYGWEAQGLQVNHFEAITPKTRPDFLKFDKKDRLAHPIHRPNPIVEFTETEKAIWYSHFMLWMKCLATKKPFVIIEHDTTAVDYFPTRWEVQRLKYFCKADKPDRHSPTNKYKFTPGAGYVLTPHGAQLMVEKTLSKESITHNVDSMLSNFRDNEPRKWCVQYAVQSSAPSTIEHL